jgi:uncharacterized protein (DUF4415 family)
MAKKERIVRATADEINAMRERGEVASDWAGAEALTAAEVERAADEDDGPLPEDWHATVELGVPEAATPVHIRLDSSVLRWFKAQGRGYQTRINAVLRAYVQAGEREANRS